jgi:hypothetical protein
MFCTDYAKRNNISPFNFESAKKAYLKKIKSPDIRKEVEKQIIEFEVSYSLFLLTRTFSGLIFTFLLCIVVFIFVFIKMLKEKRTDEKMAIAYSSVKKLRLNKTMNTPQFAYAAFMIVM